MRDEAVEKLLAHIREDYLEEDDVVEFTTSLFQGQLLDSIDLADQISV